MGEIKITRKLLDNYRKLKREIPVLGLELDEMMNGEAGLGNSTIFDYSTGFARPQSVVGFDQERYDRRKRTYGSERAWRSESGTNICARSVCESCTEPHSNITTGK